MKIIIPGGSGHLGRALARYWHAQGHSITALSRRPMDAPWEVLPWDGRTLGEWAKAVDGSDAVVNLAGRSVNCRYTARHRKEIWDSRIASTRAVGQAIAQARRPPPVWLQMSTATLYAHRFDAPNDETTGILGGSEPEAPASWRFSPEVARAWERAACETAPPCTRLVLLRTAMVMSAEPGGAFAAFHRLARLGLGGPAGHGRQYVSWIHIADFLRALDRLLEDDALSGPVNLCAPHPLPNREFLAALRAACHARIGLPAPSWLLEIGAFLLGTETELILKSRRVVPRRLLESGFEFQYPEWPQAAAALIQSLSELPKAEQETRD